MALCRERAAEVRLVFEGGDEDAASVMLARDAAALHDFVDMHSSTREKIALTVEWGKYDEDGNVRQEWLKGVTNESIAQKVGLRMPKIGESEN